MSIRVQHRRDTTTNLAGVTPAVAEIGYDTTTAELLYGDGATAGGIKLAKKSDLAAKAPLASPTFTGTVNGAAGAFTGDLTWVGAAWTSWTPTVKDQGGTTISTGTMVAKYRQNGKRVDFRISAPLTATPTGRLCFSNPVSANTDTHGSVNGENLATFKKLGGIVNWDFNGFITVALYDGTAPGTNGQTVNITGFYEAA